MAEAEIGKSGSHGDRCKCVRAMKRKWEVRTRRFEGMLFTYLSCARHTEPRCDPIKPMRMMSEEDAEDAGGPASTWTG